MNPLIQAWRGRLIVSVQAYPGEPMRHPETMAQIAQAVVEGGAAGVRAQGVGDIALIHERVAVPVIGLWKDGASGVYITPTLRHARAVRAAGADVVALDGTRRARPDGRTLAETIAALRADEPDSPGDVVVMADCGSVDDALAAAAAGVDIVGTTLSGYTGERPRTEGPDLDLIARIAAELPETPLIAEGRIHTPADAVEALRAGAHAVVVGTAITHPTSITGWFAAALDPTPRRPEGH